MSYKEYCIEFPIFPFYMESHLTPCKIESINKTVHENTVRSMYKHNNVTRP